MSLINNQFLLSLKNSQVFNTINGINSLNILNNSKRNFHSSLSIQKHHKELEFKIYRWVYN